MPEPHPGSIAAIIILAYLLGSLSFGIIYSRLRGTDVRTQDLPGGSGIYRSYGLGPAITVVILDVLKGALAAYAAQRLTPGWEWTAVFAVVTGHNYPIYFRFNGGGGIAPFIGALAVTAPLTITATLAVALTFMPLYKRFLQVRIGLNVIPATAAVALPIGLLIAARTGGWRDLLAGAVAMAVRAAHLLKQEPPKT